MSSPSLHVWLAILYMWAALTWSGGWIYATVVIALPFIGVFLVAFVRAMVRYVQHIDKHPPRRDGNGF